MRTNKLFTNFVALLEHSWAISRRWTLKIVRHNRRTFWGKKYNQLFITSNLEILDKNTKDQYGQNAASNRKWINSRYVVYTALVL